MSEEKRNEDKDDRGGGGQMADEEAKRQIVNVIHEELEDIECYHGSLLDEEIGTLLQNNGDFIMRERKESKEIILTIMRDDKPFDMKLRVKRIQVGPPPTLIYLFDNKTKMHSIKDLLQKHMMGTPIVWKKDDVMLLNPIAKQSWELRREAVELHKKLGEGAFGEVHSGKLKMRFGKLVNVAVKVIKRSENNSKATTELQKEGALMRKFKHENVVRMYGMVFERDSMMVVMELVTGGGLNDYVAKNQVSMDDKGSFALDIACGLAYLHSLNCIHRDMACRNCLIDTTRRMAKVSDFGLTRQCEVYKMSLDEKLPIRWVAPEVLKSMEYTRSADVYAYGILVWEIFANGEMPFREYNNAYIKENVQSSSFRPVFPDLTPDEIKETITKCWSSTSTERPPMEKVKKLLARFKKIGAEPENANGAPLVASAECLGGGGPGYSNKKFSRESLDEPTNPGKKSRESAESNKKKGGGGTKRGRAKPSSRGPRLRSTKRK